MRSVVSDLQHSSLLDLLLGVLGCGEIQRHEEAAGPSTLGIMGELAGHSPAASRQIRARQLGCSAEDL
jgi:hypothetical protein